MKRAATIRRLARIATPLLLAIAIFSYCAELIHLHEASAETREGLAFVQALGSSAMIRTRATAEHGPESLLIDGRLGDAAGAWRLAAGERNVATDTRIERADVFIANADLKFSKSDGFADILVDGKPLTRIGGRAIRVAGDEQSYAVPDVDAVPTGIPPGQRLGYRFPIALGEACRARDCTIGIVLHQAYWNVRSVALLFATASPAETSTPVRAASVFWVALTVALIAALSHFALSFIRSSLRTGGESAQT